jgi:Ribosomal protein S8
MSMSDPVADMLTRIRNAGMVHFQSVDMPYSKMKHHVAQIMQNEGYINAFEVVVEKGPQNTLRIDLKHDGNGNRVITGLRRVSKTWTPGICLSSRNTSRNEWSWHLHCLNFAGNYQWPAGQVEEDRRRDYL